MNFLLGLLGKKMVHSAVAKRTQGSFLDIRFGLSLLRDRRVPIGSKLFAMVLGGALMAALIAMELPLEALWAILLPGIGLGADGLIDGLEAVAGPILFGALLLPFLAPKPVVSRLRDERDRILYESAVRAA